MIGFEDFDNDVVQTSESNAVPVRPSQNMAILKQDARDGMVKLLLPNDENGDRRDDVVVKKVEFASITMLTKVSGSQIGSGTSFSNIYDVYSFGDDSKSFGLFTGNDLFNSDGPELNDARTRTVRRIFGVLRSVDGKAPNANEDIKEAFGDEPIGVYYDMPWKKFQPLSDQVKSNHFAGLDIEVSGGKKKDLAYQVKTAEGDKTNYKPAYVVTPMDDKTKDGLAKYAQDFLQETKDWIDKVRQNDAFLTDLYKNGFRQPGVVDKLRTYDLTWENYQDKLDEFQDAGKNPWVEIDAMLKDSVKPDNSPVNGGPNTGDTVTGDDQNKLFDDSNTVDGADLPF